MHGEDGGGPGLSRRVLRQAEVFVLVRRLDLFKFKTGSAHELPYFFLKFIYLLNLSMTSKCPPPRYLSEYERLAERCPFLL